jgi:elongation factor Ts
MEITASLVKELRERSGAGMMECKKALTENGGDVDVAIEWLRKQGLAKADKKAGRVAAEGRIVVASDSNRGVMVEINSETDFVAKDESFIGFTDQVANIALASGSSSVEGVLAAAMPSGGSVEEARQALVAKCGENVQVRRMVAVSSSAQLASYVHGGRIGVVVEIEGGNAEIGRGIAMHVAAMNPAYLSPEQVPAEIIAREKDIALAQVKDSGKPADVLEKMISGKVRKTLAEMCLTGQPYVIDPNVTVEEALRKAGAKLLGFHRLAVGEGIEKKSEDFAAEVMKQAGLA